MSRNTYQLGPEKRFVPERVARLVRQDMLQFLDQPLQDWGSSEVLAKFTDHVKETVKETLPRYKIFVQSYWIEEKGQGARIASKCLWNKDTDNFVSVGSDSRDGWSLVVTVFGFYFE